MSDFALARFNVHWLLWLIAPIALMFLAARVRESWVTVSLVVLSLSLTFALSNLAVTEKWRIRLDNAVSEEQMKAATADGANKVFNSYIVAPVEAVVFTAFRFGLRIRSLAHKALQPTRNPGTVEPRR